MVERTKLTLEHLILILVEIRVFFQLIIELLCVDDPLDHSCGYRKRVPHRLSTFPISPPDAGAALQRVSLRLSHPSKRSTISAGNSAPGWRFLLSSPNPSPANHDSIRRHVCLGISGVKRKPLPFWVSARSPIMPPRRQLFFMGDRTSLLASSAFFSVRQRPKKPFMHHTK